MGKMSDVDRRLLERLYRLSPKGAMITDDNKLSARRLMKSGMAWSLGSCGLNVLMISDRGVHELHKETPDAP